MIKIPYHPRYDEWSVNSYGPDCFPCAVCGKPIKDTNVKFRVYVANSGDELLSIEEAAKDPEAWEELGMFPLGSDCFRKYPELQGYVVKAERGTS